MTRTGSGAGAPAGPGSVAGGDRFGLVSAEEHAAFARIVRDHAGIKLGESKRQLLSSRLQKRLRALGLSSYAAYRRYLLAHMEEELVELISVITTNLTAFFREQHHFEFLAQYFREQPAGSSMALWSAGCATGEEAYSMAMVFRESQGARRRVTARVFATDIDLHCLEVADRGVYDLSAVKGLDGTRLSAHFLRGTGSNEGWIRVRPELRGLVEFQAQNLLDEWSDPGPFDVIFCRNVVIYFDADAQRALFERFAEVLKPGGLMMIGHSENLQRSSARFCKLGHTVYRKADG